MSAQRSSRPLILTLGLCAAAATAAAFVPWGASAATPQSIDAGLAACTTDNLGYCTVTHGLGQTPAAVLATVSTPNSGPKIASQIDTDQFTAGTFRVRVGTPTGDAFASGAVTFSYAAFSGPAPTPAASINPSPGNSTAPTPAASNPPVSGSAGTVPSPSKGPSKTAASPAASAGAPASAG